MNDTKHSTVPACHIDSEDIAATEGVARAAELLNVHPRALSRLCAEGSVPAVKVGRNWRISGAWLRRAVFGEE